MKMMKNNMILETVISPILDRDIQSNKDNSPIWKLAFKEDEITKEIYNKYQDWYKYSIKFNGLKPIQCLKISKFTLT